jgi:hypothetical protein
LSLNLLSVDGVQARHRVAAFAPALVAGDPSTSSLPTKVKSIRDKAVAI